MPLVSSIARRYASKFRGAVLFEDLFQEGSIGLMSALERVDLSRPTARAFVAMRISGAIKDHVRSYLPSAGRGNFVCMRPLDDTSGLSAGECFKEIENGCDIAAVTKGLPGRLRTVIEWDLSGRKQADLAVEMDLDQSRISQLRRLAVDRMRERV